MGIDLKRHIKVFFLFFLVRPLWTIHLAFRVTRYEKINSLYSFYITILCYHKQDGRNCDIANLYDLYWLYFADLRHDMFDKILYGIKQMIIAFCSMFSRTEVDWISYKMSNISNTLLIKSVAICPFRMHVTKMNTLKIYLH